MADSITKDASMKGISRIASKKNGYGWYVRTYFKGKTYSKFYSDSKYGSKERALKFAKKAKQFAEEQLAPLRKKNRKRKPKLVKKSKNNSTGVIGISFTRKKMSSGKYYGYFMVNWREDGKSRNTSFSCNKYGKKEAFRLAVCHRDKVMRRIYGEEYEIARQKDNNLLPSDAILEGKKMPEKITN